MSSNSGQLTQITVRLATSPDVPDLSNLYVDFLGSYGHPSKTEVVSTFLQSLLEKSWVIFLVAVDSNGKKVGFCSCTLSYSAVLHATAITIEDMFVHNDARRQGIATRLCKEVEAYAREKSFSTIFLQADPEAESAIALYKKVGFENRPYLAMAKVLVNIPAIAAATASPNVNQAAKVPGTEDQNVTQAFNYLTVVTSIILGLGFTQLLSGYARLIQVQELLFLSHWLYFGWAILLLPIHLMYWWVFWDYRKQTHWTFWDFFLLLVGPIGLYLLTALLLPESISKAGFDPTVHYINIRNWFFGILAVLQVWGILLGPRLRDGFTRKALLNSYKYAQYVLLAEFVGAFFCAPPSIGNAPFDNLVFFCFLAVIIYLLSRHRLKLETN